MRLKANNPNAGTGKPATTVPAKPAPATGKKGGKS